MDGKSGTRGPQAAYPFRRRDDVLGGSGSTKIPFDSVRRVR